MDINNILEEGKEYANSPFALLASGGKQLRNNFFEDLMQTYSINEVKSPAKILEIAIQYTADMWQEANKQSSMPIDNTQKAFFAYEVTQAVCKIYKGIEVNVFYPQIYIGATQI